MKEVQPGDDDFGSDVSPLAADHALMDAYDNLESGSVHDLSQPPHAVAVVLPNSDAAEYTDCRHGVVVFPATLNPPLPARRCPILLLTATCRNTIGVFLPGTGYLHITTTSHNYELAIAATFHKAQGRTIARVIGNLKGVDYAKIFVLISRTNFFLHAKVAPPLPGCDFSHIADLRVPDNIIAYMAGAAAISGSFDAAAARAALDIHRLSAGPVKRSSRARSADAHMSAQLAAPAVPLPQATRARGGGRGRGGRAVSAAAGFARGRGGERLRDAPVPLASFGQHNASNFCYRNGTNAAVVAVADFRDHLFRVHECAPWQAPLATLGQALSASLVHRGAVSVETAQPLAGADAVLVAPASPFFVGYEAARSLRQAGQAARVLLLTAAARTRDDAIVIAGDRAYARVQAAAEAAPAPQAAGTPARLPTPALPAAAAALRSLCTHDRSAPLVYPSNAFAFRDYANGHQQDAAEYLTELFRRCVNAPGPTTFEAQQLPPCCEYRGFSCDLSQDSVTCHGAQPHTWVPANVTDARRNITCLPIPGERALVHSSDPAASVPIEVCIGALLCEVVQEGRRCDGCNIDRVPFTLRRSFHRLPRALALHLGRGTDRWEGAVNVGSKNFRHVMLPETLDMLPYVGRRPLGQEEETALDTAGGQLLYRLVSVVVHIGGSLHGGHYTTYKRATLGGAAVPAAAAPLADGVAAGGGGGAAPEWECWNDSTVLPVTWAVVAAQPAYLVFYECTDMALLAAVFPGPA